MLLLLLLLISNTFALDSIQLFVAPASHGNKGNRLVTNAACVAVAPSSCQDGFSLLSYTGDPAAALPLRPAVPVYAGTTVMATSFTQLWAQESIPVPLALAAGVTTQFLWSGSTINGQSSPFNCEEWTSNAFKVRFCGSIR